MQHKVERVYFGMHFQVIAHHDGELQQGGLVELVASHLQSKAENILELRWLSSLYKVQNPSRKE